MPYTFYSPLATSADRFYRIDRSQVRFLEHICESEKFPSNYTNITHFSKTLKCIQFWNDTHSLSHELVTCPHMFVICDLKVIWFDLENESRR